MASDFAKRMAIDLCGTIDGAVMGLDLRAFDNPNKSYGVLGLTSCSRLLRALESRISNGFPDVIAADVRLIYETWVLSHLLMLSGRDELEEHMGGSSYWLQKMFETGNEPTDYYEEALATFPPRAPRGTFELAEALSKKLTESDLTNSTFPVKCYDQIFRNESYIGAHPSISSLVLYMSAEGRVDLPSLWFETAEARLLVPVIIVSFFTECVYNFIDIKASDIEAVTRRVVELTGARTAVWVAAISSL